MTSARPPVRAPAPDRGDGLPIVPPDDFEEQHADEIDDPIPTPGYQRLPVVALGGSAGSIPALRTFFEHTPADTGLAWVVVLHLAPGHDSMLPAILQRHALMPVRPATDLAPLEANTVYVIPPGQHLTAVDGHLRLTELQAEKGKRVAVDLFFRSVADTHGPHATVVVLSGADSDGAIGLKRVKERGGLTIAQDPDEADCAAMPGSAIATGMVDWVLPVAEMPARIAAYHARHDRLRLPEEEGPQPALPQPPSPDRNEMLLREVLAFLRARTGRDFSYYKRATIVRRISRRMQVSGVDDLAGYLSLLRTQPGEAGALLQDLLISVTNFFRDREAFEALRAMIPELFHGKQQGTTVRVWSAACATGEEAYSLAMLLLEHANKLASPPLLQVFGCDLDEAAIQVARAGFYPETIAADVSEERLRRYFVKEPGGYRVRRELREMVLFASHDLLKDAPFSRMDLVSCRNLMIYLNRDAQQRALEIFHFALKPGGLLFLGASESVDDHSTLFVTLDKKHRIHRHLPTHRAALPLPASGGEGAIERALQRHEQLKQAGPMLPGRAFFAAPALPPREAPALAADGPAADQIHFKLLGRWGPPSIVVDAQHDVVHLSENAHRFLQFPEGEPTRNLMRLVHPMLRVELRAALLRAQESGAPVELYGRPVDLPGGPLAVDLRIAPGGDLAPGCMLVLFEAHEVAEPVAAADGLAPASPTGAEMRSEAVVQQLERELTRANAALRATVEQYEASTEELKASNEELQAMNEELRSAGEELETSREEMQSVNEELSTVNAEFRNRVEELSRANSDLHNLMSSTQIATVFLDRELRVMRYTPSAAPLFNFIPGDIGRPIGHLNRRLDYRTLDADAEQVLRTLVPVERELEEGGHWYLARVLPYRTVDDHIAGVVLTFFDITERRRAEAALRASDELMRAMADNLPGGAAFVVDRELRYVLAGGEALQAAGLRAEHFVGRRVADAVGPELAAVYEPRYRGVLEGQPFSHEHESHGRHYLTHGSPLRDTQGRITAALAVSYDITDRKSAEDAVRRSEERLRLLADAVPQIIWANDGAGEANYFNRRWYEYTGLGFEQSKGPGWMAIVHPDDEAASAAHWLRVLAAGEVFDCEYRLRGADGRYRWFIGRNVPVRDAAGEVTGWFGTATDIDELKSTEAALRASEEQFRRAIEDAPIPVVMQADDGEVLQISKTWTRLTGYGPDEITNSQAWLGRTDGPGTERLRDHLGTLLQGAGGPLDTELDVTTRSGERRHWLFSTSAPGTLRDGRRFVVGMALDVTDRRRAEEALRDSREQLELIVENASEYAIFSLDLERRITSWNTGAQAILGFAREEAIGRSGDMIFTDEDRAAGAPEREAAQALAEGRAADERWHVRKDGSRFWGSGVMMPMRDGGGQAVGLVKIFRDQTAELRAKQALEESRAQLGEALLETERARDEAQAAGKAKDHFLAVLSHELRTPLTPLLLAAQVLLRHKDLPATAAHALAIVQRNARLQTQLVDDLLDVTRISRGKIELAPEPLDLHDVIARAVEVSVSDIEAKHQHLTIELAAAEHALQGDAKRLQQVFWNLLKNASKFTGEGGALSIRSRNEPGRVVVEVADTGIGFEPEAAERIFTAFEQASRDITRRHGGLGLGLAIAEASVKAHGGRIVAASEGPGRGATFTVELPLAPPH